MDRYSIALGKKPVLPIQEDIKVPESVQAKIKDKMDKINEQVMSQLEIDKFYNRHDRYNIRHRDLNT